MGWEQRLQDPPCPATTKTNLDRASENVIHRWLLNIMWSSRALWNAKMNFEYFSVPAPRAAGGGQDQHPADAALWLWILKKLEPFWISSSVPTGVGIPTTSWKFIKIRKGKLDTQLPTIYHSLHPKKTESGMVDLKIHPFWRVCFQNNCKKPTYSQLYYRLSVNFDS